MHDAGYDPVQMARFFEKLEQEGQRDNSAVTNFFSDHPTPGRRVEYVQAQNLFLPKIQYRDSGGSELERMKTLIASLPPPPRPESRAGGRALPPAQVRPSGRFKQYQTQTFRLNYPENWETFGSQDAPMVTIAPRGALVADAQGQTHIGFGMIASYYIPQARSIDLNRETNNLVQQLVQGNPGLRRGRERQRYVQVAGQRALLTQLESPSSYVNETEIDMLMTLARPEGLFYILFIAPQSEWDGVSRDFNNILGSLQFSSR
jgi:predicted Zn-dependent protease